MQTSCGSPCYAAPELVISEGLYVGSAVDIWSCGVILYAMLAGYLPFDDDPANPDGDNINLLYKYIVNTPLSFPEYISPEARDLLGMMLVPDPNARADLETVMDHGWLRPFKSVFDRGVEELERAAMELHQMKRLAYQRQMKMAAAATSVTGADANGKVARTQSARPDAFGGAAASSSGANRTQSYNKPHAHYPEYLYETSTTADPSSSSPPVIPPLSAGAARRGIMATPSPAPLDDDPFASTPSPMPSPLLLSPGNVSVNDGLVVEEVLRSRTEGKGKAPAYPYTNPHSQGQGQGQLPLPPPPSAKATPEKKRGAFRHTIQVEYGDPDVQQQQDSQAVITGTPRESTPSAQVKSKPVVTTTTTSGSPSTTRKQPPELDRSNSGATRNRTISHDSPRASSGVVGSRIPTSVRRPQPQEDEMDGGKPLPAAPSQSNSPRNANTSNSSRSPPTPPSKTNPTTPVVSIAAATPPTSPSSFPGDMDKAQQQQAQAQLKRGTGSTGSRSSKNGGHKRGLSVDKLGLGKIFGSNASGGRRGEGAGELKVQTNGMTSRVPSDGSAVTDEKQLSSSSTGAVTAGSATTSNSNASSSLLSPAAEPTSAKKSRRNTLTIMVGTIKGKKGGNNTQSKSAGTSTPASASVKEKHVSQPPPQFQPQARAPPLSATTMRMQPPATPTTFRNASKTNIGIGMGIPASTNKANKVMQWFRSKSKGTADAPAPSFLSGDPLSSSEATTNTNTTVNNSSSNLPPPTTPTQAAYTTAVAASSSTATVNQQQDKSWYSERSTRRGGGQGPVRTASTGTDASFSIPTLADRVRRSVGVAVTAPPPQKGVLRIHHGAVDHSTITTRPPPEVMKHVRDVLEGMGVDIRLESEFKYRCIRMKRKRVGGGVVGLGLRDVGISGGSGSGLAAVNIIGSAASNGVS